METKKMNKTKIGFLIIASLILLFAIVDSIFLKITDGSGLIALGICSMAIAVSANAMNNNETRKVKLNPKTEKIFKSVALFLIVSGIITAIAAA